MRGTNTTLMSPLLAAADDARRRFERDLHDGAQQRLVSLRLELRNEVEVLPVVETTDHIDIPEGRVDVYRSCGPTHQCSRQLESVYLSACRAADVSRIRRPHRRRPIR